MDELSRRRIDRQSAANQMLGCDTNLEPSQSLRVIRQVRSRVPAIAHRIGISKKHRRRNPSADRAEAAADQNARRELWIKVGVEAEPAECCNDRAEPPGQWQRLGRQYPCNRTIEEDGVPEQSLIREENCDQG